MGLMKCDYTSLKFENLLYLAWFHVEVNLSRYVFKMEAFEFVEDAPMEQSQPSNQVNLWELDSFQMNQLDPFR